MPILDVEIVHTDSEPPRPGLVSLLADAAGEIFGSPPSHTWVRVRLLPSSRYGENATEIPPLPVFVSVLKAKNPAPDALKIEIEKLTREVARIVNRPEENVHIFYRPEGSGRVAFGGELVE